MRNDIMEMKIWTSDEICQRMLTKAAPLPCRKAFVRQVSAMLALHVNRNTLIDLVIDKLMERASNEDLIQFGMMPELVGRIGSAPCISSLGAEDYKQLLSILQPGTLLYQYSRYLACAYGVELSIDHSAILRDYRAMHQKQQRRTGRCTAFAYDHAAGPDGCRAG